MLETTLALAFALPPFLPAQQSDYDQNWAALAGNPPALIFAGPQFDPSSPDFGPGEGLRLCYSYDVTQGGRNDSGLTPISYIAVTQAYGPANPVPGVSIGSLSIRTLASDDLGDDVCLVDFGVGLGNAWSSNILDLGAPGLIAGTGGYSVVQGAFWDIAFEFAGTNLPSVANAIGQDPVDGGPLLGHLVYEIQGPADPGTFRNQYFLASTAEPTGRGQTTGVTGGITVGNSQFGLNAYGADATQTGAAAGSRFFSLAGSLPQLGLLSNDATFEWFSAVALQTPYLTGVNNGNAGVGGADWTLSAPGSRVELRVLDDLSGAQSPLSPSPISDPTLLLNFSYNVWHATPATKLQSPLNWQLGVGGSFQPGNDLLPIQTTRAGQQRVSVTTDAVFTQFLGQESISLMSEFTPSGIPLTQQIYNKTAGSSDFAGDPLLIQAPLPSAVGVRFGVQNVGIQVRASGLEYTELSSYRTVIPQ